MPLPKHDFEFPLIKVCYLERSGRPIVMTDRIESKSELDNFIKEYQDDAERYYYLSGDYKGEGAMYRLSDLQQGKADPNGSYRESGSRRGKFEKQGYSTIDWILADVDSDDYLSSLKQAALTLPQEYVRAAQTTCSSCGSAGPHRYVRHDALSQFRSIDVMDKYDAIVYCDVCSTIGMVTEM